MRSMECPQQSVWTSAGRMLAAKWIAGVVAMLAASFAAPLPLAAEDTPPVPVRAPDAPPPPPADPLAPKGKIAARAFDVLKRHCARCHDHRRLNDRPLAASPVANILNLDRLATRGDLVLPGRPEASPLYLSMITRHMPYDVFEEADGGRANSEPSATDIDAVREWIAGLTEKADCPSQSAWKQQMTAAIDADLARLPAEHAARRRYLSLFEIAPRCQTSEDKKRIDEFQQASAKLLNLLSLAYGPMRPEPVGKNGLLLAFDVKSIGWTADRWQRLADHHGAAAQLPAEIIGKTGTVRPVLPAHWFAHEALKPGVYETLLGVPRELQAVFTTFRLGDHAQAAATSETISHSHITGGPRRISRNETNSKKPLWIAQDFAPSASATNAQPIQSRVIFTLPNGFPGFATYANSGALRQSVHKDVVPKSLAGSSANRSGLYCLSCHRDGAVARPTEAPAKDDAASQPSTIVQTSAIVLRQDLHSASQAFHVAGIEPELTIDGIDPVLALANSYTRDLSLASAATELGQSPSKLRGRLLALKGSLQAIARRLAEGQVSRDEFEALRAQLQDGELASARPDQLSSESTTTSLRLSIWSDKTAYADGEPVILHATATAPCHLTLISIDHRGEAAVIFPSEFNKKNELTPRQMISVPAKGDAFILRKDTALPERVVGICMAGNRKSPPGIYHEFELQHFTLLGPWKDHLKRALEADAAERKNAGKPVKKRKKSRRRRYHQKPQLPFRPDRLPLEQSWALITLQGQPAIPVSSQD